MYPDTGYRCGKCGMHFHVVEQFPFWGEITRCSVPTCTVRFNHSSLRPGATEAKNVRCEVRQADLEEPAHG